MAERDDEIERLNNFVSGMKGIANTQGRCVQECVMEKGMSDMYDISNYTDPPLDWHDPDWENAQKVHEWKNYIFPPLQRVWGEFTMSQQQLIAANAEYQADQENWD